MKKFASVLLILIVFTMPGMTLFAAETNVTINVYNWGEYISDGSEGSLDVNEEFTKATGIKVNYTTYSSNEDLYAKLKSGATGYDVIIPSDYMIQRMIKEDMLEELDFNNIPNYVNISDEYKNLFYDPDNQYSVPYAAGMVGIIYNTKKIDETPKSWSIMWDEKYSGKILTFNNPRDAFGTAMFLLGIDPNTTDKDKWKQALDKLAEQKPLIQSYVMDEIYNKMESGEAAIAPYYAGDFLSMYQNNSDLAFVFPEEGTNIFVDAICIPKGSENKEAAEKYINFILSGDIAIANAEYICYTCPNKLVMENEGYIEYLSELHKDAYEMLYPTKTDFKTYYYKNLPSDILTLENDLWEELKTDSSLGIGVYIGCGIIVLLVGGFFVFKAIQKKKRSDY